MVLRTDILSPRTKTQVLDFQSRRWLEPAMPSSRLLQPLKEWQLDTFSFENLRVRWHKIIYDFLFTVSRSCLKIGKKSCSKSNKQTKYPGQVAYIHMGFFSIFEHPTGRFPSAHDLAKLPKKRGKKSCSKSNKLPKTHWLCSALPSWCKI